MLAPSFGASLARARAAHYAAFKWRIARSTASLRNACQTLRNDVVERAVRHLRTAQCGTHARATPPPKTGASIAR
eukprot:6109272-Lingulodinium_polyedra.AAC.1